MCIMPYCALYILVHMDHSELWALWPCHIPGR
jgi:hypothetical protein